eukprot:TRINITY_DN33195_c0_g1_i1.p1 TRINITY_DN33195_c0_g1~~TRINITY_DN33195_c0_g1_i1.p1  ORF type:complete len:322 (-),score=87.72 TRINITY_DN33195_c0_g1_i1:108-1073(-)
MCIRDRYQRRVRGARKMAQWNTDGNMTQEDFMLRDKCILLDAEDNVVGFDDKYETHIFCPERPRGKLHRAFSVFLFDSDNKLLLQQRAAEKITFPNVWTNTCCSHPLTGLSPTEVDGPEELRNATVPGVKRAAVRKLLHELGIPAEQVPEDQFKFLTRLHYWAVDAVTHGSEAIWGEHEIDYILLIKADVTVDANPEEVSATKSVTREECVQMLQDDSLLWSPWCRVIAEQFLLPDGGWWHMLDEALTTDKFVDTTRVHTFDCPETFWGGHGNAGAFLSVEGGTDPWLESIKANGGKAPEVTPNKERVNSDNNGVWSLKPL